MSKINDLIKRISGNVPTNRFTIEDEDEMVLLGKINEVIAKLEQIRDEAIASDGTKVVDYNGNKLDTAKFSGTESINVDLKDGDPNNFEFRVDQTILNEVNKVKNKQDTLTAGHNIKIDETNKISSNTMVAIDMPADIELLEENDSFIVMQDMNLPTIPTTQAKKGDIYQVLISSPNLEVLNLGNIGSGGAGGKLYRHIIQCVSSHDIFLTIYSYKKEILTKETLIDYLVNNYKDGECYEIQNTPRTEYNSVYISRSISANKSANILSIEWAKLEHTLENGEINISINSSIVGVSRIIDTVTEIV